VTAAPSRRRDAVTVGCTVDLADRDDRFHALVDLDDGVVPRPGDRVTVHLEADDATPAAGRAVLRRRATVVRAGWLRRRLTPLISCIWLTDLFEVGMPSRRAP
jgi:hypothetical protein